MVIYPHSIFARAEVVDLQSSRKAYISAGILAKQNCVRVGIGFPYFTSKSHVSVGSTFTSTITIFQNGGSPAFTIGLDHTLFSNSKH